MNVLTWIIFGGLVGWLASVLTGRNSRMGCLANILVGVLGAFIGGWIVSFFTGSGFSPRFELYSFIVALGGACLLLTVTGLFARRKG